MGIGWSVRTHRFIDRLGNLKMSVGGHLPSSASKAVGDFDDAPNRTLALRWGGTPADVT
jgi:hypothetical protein